MANFSPPPPQFPRPLTLQPELLPVTVVSGSFVAGVGAGRVTATGTPASLNIGQSFNVGAGKVIATGAPAGLSFGQQIVGFNVGAGQVTAFGYVAAIGVPASLAAPPTLFTPAPFAPALSELGLDAFERIGIQAGELTHAHISSLRRSMNFTLVRYANNGIALWEVAKASITLLPGVSTYVLPTALIELLDTYISVGGSDIIVTSVSRNTYAALPRKAQQGRPNLVWFDKTITPSITVWPVPDANSTYTLTYYGWSQVADADPAQGNTANLPYRFLEAYVAGVAANLAMKFAPERAVALKGYADEIFIEAADADREVVTLKMQPDLSSYF